MNRITTKNGDQGETHLLFGQRILKSSLQVEVCGNVDELNSALGVAKSNIPSKLHIFMQVKKCFSEIQKNLCTIMTYVMLPANNAEFSKKVTLQPLNSLVIKELEEKIANLESVIPQITDWIIPGTEPISASIHWARTICRRAERSLFRFLDSEYAAIPEFVHVNQIHAIYLNRLSDLLWLIAVAIESKSLTKDNLL